MLAAEIARDLPTLTVHDVSHLDALWDMTDLVAGSAYEINPLEGFVLGGAFLIHDLGLGLAAGPGGIDELRRDIRWSDTVVSLFLASSGRSPSSDEIANPPADIARKATESLLRQLHAERAERLALMHWTSAGVDYHLIEDVELRNAFGALIGALGHSHWWSTNELPRRLGVGRKGAPSGYPRNWTIDPIKLACLLRVADVAHVDADRAPGFLAALRGPEGLAKLHWLFQEKLAQPIAENDRLVYTASAPFAANEAEAWWLCFETIAMIDSELSAVDALLADLGRARLAVTGVAGAGDARRLAKHVVVDGWIPVDAHLDVTDVAALVLKLGGSALYGDNLLAPVRELVQNAGDAIRARRYLESRDPEWGEIVVSLTESDDGAYWLVVDDNGIGMSENVLAGPFLDFGASFWTSPLAQSELPGILSRGFRSTGTYGIGFFSVFMLGEQVQVITRRPSAARQDTLILDFQRGLRLRPILRSPMSDDEWLNDGGTRVRVKLSHPPHAKDGLLGPGMSQRRLVDLPQALRSLCPAIDSNLHVEHLGEPRLNLVRASDWITLDPVEFLVRLWGRESLEREPKLVHAVGQNLRLLTDAHGTVVGRAALCPMSIIELDHPEWISLSGSIVCGGLKSAELYSIAGLMVGVPSRASRDEATPTVGADALAVWASEQARLAHSAYGDWPRRAALRMATVVRAFAGDTGPLPIALSSDGSLSFEEIVIWAAKKHEIILTVLPEWEADLGHYGLKLSPNVLQTEWSAPHITRSPNWPMPDSADELDRFTLLGSVALAIARAWGIEVDDLVEEQLPDELAIGELGGKPFMDTYVIRVSRPSTTS